LRKLRSTNRMGN